MANIVINGKSAPDVQILKLDKGEKDAAFKAASSGTNGTDDVFFEVGEDTYVASGRGLLEHYGPYILNLLDKDAITVEYNGKEREVVDAQNQANTTIEGSRWAMQMPGLVIGAMGILYVSGRAFKAGAIFLGGLAALGIGGGIFGPRRPLGLEELNRHGTVVDEHEMSDGGLLDALAAPKGRSA